VGFLACVGDLSCNFPFPRVSWLYSFRSFILPYGSSWVVTRFFFSFRPFLVCDACYLAVILRRVFYVGFLGLCFVPFFIPPSLSCLLVGCFMFLRLLVPLLSSVTLNSLPLVVLVFLRVPYVSPVSQILGCEDRSSVLASGAELRTCQFIVFSAGLLVRYWICGGFDDWW